MVGILPPLHGSNVNIAFPVGYVRVAHFTHGWDTFAAMRLCGVLRAAGRAGARTAQSTAGRRRHYTKRAVAKKATALFLYVFLKFSSEF